MAINASKVVVGGLVAGVVANIAGFVLFGLWLGPRIDAELSAVAPTLAGRGATGKAIGTQIVSSFVVGLLLVWLYASMRPRFGPGPKTAMLAAFVVWICGFLFHVDLLLLGTMTPATYLLASLAAAVQLIAASWVGGKLYSEPAAA